ncbi:MAG: type III-B CRISPR module RAMP protein Cmr6 [Candidatus Magnetoovum sp. WYHC-5]|nr:type III-B CRISPR module RAMP protein Cmr6 [Candidatus Magnetoovum sp. WYHC-5]
MKKNKSQKMKKNKEKQGYKQNDCDMGTKLTNASFIYYKYKDINNINNNYGKCLQEKGVQELLNVQGNIDSSAKINGIPYMICCGDADSFFEIKTDHKFTLTTTYPGLIIGIGYNHPSRKDDDKEATKVDSSDFQLGFYFDHTSGMPVIPGSTVKGILKARFPKKSLDSYAKPEKPEEQELAILRMYDMFCTINKLCEKEDIKDVRIGEDNWEDLFCKNDVFYDAFISHVPDGKIFAEDYITPHGKNPLKNPTPIRFLKIAPNVQFTFQFKLHDSILLGGKKITAEQKCCLFKRIIGCFGIGAKRNVGYGYFNGFDSADCC